MKNVAPLALVLSFALACSPATVAGPDAGGAHADATKECKDRAYAFCSRLQTCSPTAVQLRYGDESGCESILSALCRNANEAPSTGATPAHAEACAGAIAGWACNDILYAQNTPPECRPEAGSLPAGAPCTVREQCQSTYCSHFEGSACGVCAPLPEPGASCAATTCPESLDCVAPAMICASFADVGAQCGATQPCNAGLTCVGISGGSPGVCQAGVQTAGAACSFLGAGCDLFSGLSCNAQKGTCATAQLVPAGGACGVVANQTAYCIQGACVHGACVANAGIGAPCDLVAGPPCGVNARCIVSSDGGTSGSCQLPSATACP